MTTNGEAIANNTVIVRRLRADPGQQNFKDFRPLSPDMVRESNATSAKSSTRWRSGAAQVEPRRLHQAQRRRHPRLRVHPP